MSQSLPKARSGLIHKRLGFGAWLTAVMALAFLVREYFVLATIVDIPIRGDIREYVIYAWNLYNHSTFSLTPPGEASPAPDAYRSPGYPWLLALCMWLRPTGEGWYNLALQFQVFLGTATVWLTALLARRWLSPGGAVAAGLLIALWPHHIAATGALLSEVLFGFSLIAALYFFGLAFNGRSVRGGFVALSAASFGFAFLTNPLIALFPIAVGLILLGTPNRKIACLFAGIVLAPMLAFGLRNAQLEDSHKPPEHRIGRAAMNLVQGSWPEYHTAWKLQRLGDPTAVAIMEQINNELLLLNDHPLTGLRDIASRLCSAPVYYGSWYLWRKPWLLWGWGIEIGYGGVYVLEVRNSPLATHPLLRWGSASIQAVNPLMTALALVCAAALLAGGWLRKTWAPPAAIIVGAMALYLTAVHVVFQAEPRYAIAYRAIEVLLVATTAQWMARGLSRGFGALRAARASAPLAS